MTQYQKLARLLTRASGATPMEMTVQAGTVSVHSRLAELKARGWTITRKPVHGKTYGRYHGKAPKAA